MWGLRVRSAVEGAQEAVVVVDVVNMDPSLALSILLIPHSI